MSIHSLDNERLEKCRVYKVIYTIIGRNSKALTQIRACVVAMDVAELADNIRNKILGAEITVNDDEGNIKFHEVAEAVEIESAELIGRLHGITDASFNVIRKCNSQEADQ